LDTIDVQQLHVWNAEWIDNDEWRRAFEDLKKSGKAQAVGVSINDHQPDSALDLVNTGLIDTVQVIYNIFDQSPEDELFPACREMETAVIARVPFDEGTLTGTLTKESRWPEGDWRNTYFVPENLIPSVERADALKPLVPVGMTMPEMTLRFILTNPTVSTVIPGMRKLTNVEANLRASDGQRLSGDVTAELKRHRWDRWIDIP
jgi:aryl-alcohol dehydrogenase-like predicted oxidoreductase